MLLLRPIPVLMLLSLPVASLLADEIDKEAIKQLNQVIQTRPDDAAVYLERGERYRDDSEYRLALIDFNTAERLNPDLPTIDLARAKVYNDINRHELTEEYLLRFLRLKPHNLKALRLLVGLYIKRERYQEADAIYARILDTFAEPALSFYFLRSQNRESYGDLAGALAVIEAAIQAAGWQPMLENKAIDCEIKLGQHQAAIQRLDRLVERDGKRQYRYYQKKAEILLLLDDPAAARKNFVLALTALDERHPTLTYLPALKALREDLAESIRALGESDSDGRVE